MLIPIKRDPRAALDGDGAHPSRARIRVPGFAPGRGTAAVTALTRSAA